MNTQQQELRQQEINQMVDDSNVFEEGNEPIDISTITSEPTSKGELGETKVADYNYLNNLAELFNEGQEDEEKKIKFEDIIAGKDAEGNPIEAKTVKEKIVNSILDRVALGNSPEVDAYVREVITNSYNEDFDLEQYKASGNVSPQDPQIDWSDTENVLKMAYSAKYGEGTDANLSEEEIEEQIRKLSSADKKLMVAELKQAAKVAQQYQQEEYIKKEEEEFKGRVKKFNDDVSTSVELLKDKSKQKDIFGGFKLTQRDKNEYLEEIPGFMTRELEKREDGNYIAISKAEKVLQEIIKNPESMMELIPFLWLKSKGKLDAYSTLLTEGAKAEMLDRLDDHPTRTVTSSTPKEADIESMLDDDNVFETYN